jgi:hypothetical protein
MIDSARKGRHRHHKKGSAAPRHIADEIRKLYAVGRGRPVGLRSFGKYRQIDLAEMFGISRHAVAWAIYGPSWKSDRAILRGHNNSLELARDNKIQ